jgi:hypothetical protein
LLYLKCLFSECFGGLRELCATRRTRHLESSELNFPIAILVGMRPIGHCGTVFLRACRAMSSGASRITSESKCVGCEGIASVLSPAQVEGFKSLIPGWSVDASYSRLSKRLRVRNFSVRALDVCDLSLIFLSTLCDRGAGAQLVPVMFFFV